ncbi:MAG: methyltransferase domain-containing protein [Thermoleophilia bacterium]|nr:methyltransferase domain-containing protein [Thermoleophilia bacterium]
MSDTTYDPEAFTAFETEGWNAIAEGYGGFFGRFTARCAGPLLDAAGVGPGARVLDVATGPGYVAAAAAARGAEATGLDIAAGMVALASRLHPEVTFVQGDAERLPFADASFDAVVGGFCILHFARPERALADWVRVLRPGGRVAVSMWAEPARNRVLGVAFDAVLECATETPAGMPVGPPLFRFSDERELAGLLEGAGLAEASVQPVSFVERFDGPDEVWEGILASTVRTRGLLVAQDEETQAKIRACFERLCAEHRCDGGIELPVEMLVAAGRRP